MGGPAGTDVTQLLAGAARGDRQAADSLLPLLYEQLRALANRQMAEERAGHTLQATALVHEAYLRLLGDTEVEWAGRAHFYAAAAEAMRRILIEHARGRGRVKRGGDRKREPLNVLDLAADHDPEEILILDNAIRRLGEGDSLAARVVHLRFYAGLSVEDTARALGVSEPTVKRRWRFARAWLHDALGKGEGESPA